MCADLVSNFSVIKDPRSDKNKRYPLDEILLLSICAVVSGAEGWEGIEAFGRAKLKERKERGQARLFLLRRLPENDTPDCTGFSFVIKARQPAHSRTILLLSQHRRRTKRPTGWDVSRQKSP
ncbi:MAG: transposase family protein [Pseudomonadota bacterium]|nr:transposase family protein [Pseudomonadota bacterium]